MFCIIYVGLAESCDMPRDDLDSPMVPICQNKFQGSFQFVLIAELSLQLFSPSQSWQDILSLLFPGQWNDNNMQLERHKKVVGPLIFWEFILEIDWNVVYNNKSALNTKSCIMQLYSWQCMFPWQLLGNHHVFMWVPEKSCVTMKSAARCSVQTGAGPMTMYFIKWDCKIRPRESVIQCSSNFVKLWDDDTIKQSRNNFLPRYNLIILQSILVLAVGFQI